MQVQPLLIQNIKTYSDVNKNHPNNVKPGDISFDQLIRFDNGKKSVKDFFKFLENLTKQYNLKAAKELEYASLVKDGKCSVVVDIPDANVAMFIKIAEELEKE